MLPVWLCMGWCPILAALSSCHPIAITPLKYAPRKRPMLLLCVTTRHDAPLQTGRNSFSDGGGPRHLSRVRVYPGLRYIWTCWRSADPTTCTAWAVLDRLPTGHSTKQNNNRTWSDQSDQRDRSYLSRSDLCEWCETVCGKPQEDRNQDPFGEATGQYGLWAKTTLGWHIWWHRLPVLKYTNPVSYKLLHNTILRI